MTFYEIIFRFFSVLVKMIFLCLKVIKRLITVFTYKWKICEISWLAISLKLYFFGLINRNIFSILFSVLSLDAPACSPQWTTAISKSAIKMFVGEVRFKLTWKFFSKQPCNFRNFILNKNFI